MHVELWRSMALFNHRCSLRTWVTRVANNVGASHVIRRRRAANRPVALDDLDTEIVAVNGATQADSSISAAKLLSLIHQLKTVDRQIMLLYLEGDAAEQIADITGFSASNVAVVKPPVRGRSKVWNTRIKAGLMGGKECGNRFINRRKVEWK